MSRSSGARRWLIRNVPLSVQPHLRSIQLSLTRVAGRVLRALPGTSLSIGPPRHLALTLPQYVKEHGGASHSYVELYPSVTVRRSPPTVVGGVGHVAFSDHTSHTVPAAGVAAIANGRVLTSSGGVIGPDDYLIADVSDNFLAADPWTNSHLAMAKLPRLIKTTETVGVLTTYRSDIYYHWLLDTLPRLHLLHRHGVAFDRLVVPQGQRFQRESLERLGIPASQLLSERGLQVQANTLLVPSLPGHSGNPPRWACDFLRDTFLAGVPSSGRSHQRVFVSRQRAGSRPLTNEDELVTCLEDHGFHTVFLEELSFQSQVELFHHAEVVLSSHGSGLANLVFCQPGTRVIELFSPNYVNVMYWALCDQLGLNYSYLVSESRAAPLSHRGRVHEAILVDVDTVENALQGLPAE